MGRADLVPRTAGVVAGFPSQRGFSTWRRAGSGADGVRFRSTARRSDRAVLATVRGPVRGLLTAERTALNLLGAPVRYRDPDRRRWGRRGRGDRCPDTSYAASPPGPAHREKLRGALWRWGEPSHVVVGRGPGSKDNHVAAAGGVVTAFDPGPCEIPRLAVESEVDTVAQAREVIDAGADLVLRWTTCRRARCA